MGQRITRAKGKIAAAHIPYRMPSADDLPARVSGVLAVLFLVFNEGYLASGPDTDPLRPGLTDARRPARVTPSGELVPLPFHDRLRWDTALIAKGHALVRGRLRSGEAPGRYQLLAAINAVHTSALSAETTDWSQIVALYDQLVRLDPSPVVVLSRVIAVGELDGAGLTFAVASLTFDHGWADAAAGVAGVYHLASPMIHSQDSDEVVPQRGTAPFARCGPPFARACHGSC